MFYPTLQCMDECNLDIIKELKEHNPDILALVEISKNSFMEKHDEICHFTKELGLKHRVVAEKYGKRYKRIPVMNKQCNAILSKNKISGVKREEFHEGVKRVVIEGDINVGKKIRLMLVHLALGKRDGRRQIDELKNFVGKIESPLILMSDFNTFKGDSKLKDLLKETDLEMSKRGNTFPSYYPDKGFDYVLTRGIKVKDYKVLKLNYSDYLPVMVDFSVR